MISNNTSMVSNRDNCVSFGLDEAYSVFGTNAFYPSYGNEEGPQLGIFVCHSDERYTHLDGKVYFGQKEEKSKLHGVAIGLDGEVVYDRVSKTVIKNTLTKELQKMAQKMVVPGGKMSLNWCSVIGAPAAWGFAAKILSECNPYAYAAVMAARTAFFCDERTTNLLAVSNILSMFIDYPNEMEKILKISPRTIKSGWERVPVSGLISSNKSKVPNSVLQWANKQTEPTKLLSLLQTICDHEDANNAVIFQDFINQMKRLKMIRTSYDEFHIGKFYDRFARLIEMECGYTTKKLIDYLIRQNYFYGKFTGPYSEIYNLVDYAELALGAGLEFDKYPTDVFKGHNIMTRNVTALELTDEERAAFEEKNAKAAKKYELKYKGYVVIIPRTVEELVKEGNDLSHCVAGYSRRIAEGKTVVGFLRKEDAPDVSLYTIEMDGKKVIQAKGACNEDLPADALRIVGEIEAKW